MSWRFDIECFYGPINTILIENFLLDLTLRSFRSALDSPQNDKECVLTGAHPSITRSVSLTLTTLP